MKVEGECLLARIFLGESDRAEGMPLHAAIVRRARAAGLAGATVLRGLEGFGAHSRIHTARILRLSEDLPIVVEIVEREERLLPFLEEIEPLITDGLVTLEKVRVILYRAPGAAERGEDGTGGAGDAAD